jgi:3-deoxy-D-arabino-heptulosonate 7-phosphate (DAHP) synthase
MSDGAQSLDFAEFAELMPRIGTVTEAVGRSLSIPSAAVI